MEPIVKECTSIRGVCEQLGLKHAGGTHSHLRKRIDEYGINTSHFKGKAQKGVNKPLRRGIEDYLSNRVPAKSHTLKLRLYREGLKKEKCEVCGITAWNGEQLGFELDHINCNHEDNTLSNLQILCPNCHAQKTRKDREIRKKSS